MADKLEALAKAMLAAWRATNPNAPMWANPEDWYDLMDTLAEAALRFLGCVNSKGEVMAPGRGAVGKARQALGDAEELFSSDLWSHAQLRVLVHSLLDALRALRGEGGET